MPLQELGVGAKVHLKNEGRVVLRGDVVVDDPGSYAVLTEQGSAVSLKIAAQVLDVVATVLGCRTSKRRRFSLHQSQNAGRSETAETSQIWMC